MNFGKLQGPFQDGDLLLRPLIGRDAGELFLLVDQNRTALGRWLPWVPATRAIADSRFYILSLNGFWKSGLGLGVFWRDELIGTTGFQNGDERNDRVEVGYWLAPPYQGQGLGKRALRLALQAAFSHTSVHRIAARVQAENLPSIGLLESLGFVFEGVERQGLKFRDHHRDHRVYSLLRPEFSV